MVTWVTQGPKLSSPKSGPVWSTMGPTAGNGSTFNGLSSLKGKKHALQIDEVIQITRFMSVSYTYTNMPKLNT